jgi:hypothetical protein
MLKRRMPNWLERMFYRGRYLVTLGAWSRHFKACGVGCAKYKAWYCFTNSEYMSFDEFCKIATVRKIT